MNETSGWIIIGSKLDNKQLEKDLKSVQTKLGQFEKENEKLATAKLKAEADLQPYQEEINALRKEIQEAEKLNMTSKQRKFVEEEHAMMLENINSKYSKQIENYNTINKKIEENAVKQGLVKNEIQEINSKLQQTYAYKNVKNKVNEIGDAFKNLASKSSLKNISKKIDSIGKSVSGITKKVLKWGLALFGIRAAYGFIRQAASTVMEYNEGLSNQIKFMRTVIATALEPIIKTVISLVYTLLSFINSIVVKLTGKNLFEAAKKNMQSGAKSAKEMKKQLAGFDEMNVLSENSSDSSSGFSTSGFVEENSKLLDILNKFKEMILSGDWEGIAKTISRGIINGLNWLKEKIKSLDWEGTGRNISSFLTNIDFSGILVSLAEVFGEAVLGFQNLMLAIDWPTIFKNLGNAIANAIFKIDEYIKMIKWSEIGKMISDTFNSIPWGALGSSIISTIWDAIMGLIEMFLSIDWKQVGKTLSDTIHSWIETIIQKFKETDWEKLGKDIVDAIFDFIEGVDWFQLAADIINGLVEGILALVKLVVAAFNELLKRILEFFGIHSPSTVFADIGNNIMKGLINGLKSLFNDVVNIFANIVNAIKNVFSNVVNWIRNNIINPIVNLFGSIGTKVGETISGAFKGVVNSVLGAVESILNFPIKSINKLISVINSIPGINLGKLPTFRLPRLAKGGIINMPGKGVPVGSAIAGERGAEGVIPLTDSQQMDLLGQAIGKYVSLNATIPVYVGNRQIAREIKRIDNESDFAFNR